MNSNYTQKNSDDGIPGGEHLNLQEMVYGVNFNEAEKPESEVIGT